jgi:hypothetical protein
MVARTNGNNLAVTVQRREGNPRAVWSVVFGLLSALSVPVALVIQYYSLEVTLVQSTISAAPAIVLGLYAIILARRGRETHARTIGRSGGSGAARVGRVLGTFGLCLGLSTALAVGFYGLLTLFAKS